MPRPVRAGVTAVLAVALAGVVGTGLAVATGQDLQGIPALDRLTPGAWVEVDGRSVRVPRPEPSDGRVRPAVAVTTTGVHAFLHTADDGAPVGYDPCRPVPYVVRPDGAPSFGPAVLEEAVAVVEDATGLDLVDVGTTDEPPAADRPLIQPDRYGTGWAPVLVAWSDEDESDELAGPVAGVAGSAAVPGASGDGTWLAAGRMVLDAEDLTAMAARPDGRERVLSVVVHELAHVVGLDHVDATSELMHPMASTATGLGPGDRQGLALLGQVPCQR